MWRLVRVTAEDLIVSATLIASAQLLFPLAEGSTIGMPRLAVTTTNIKELIVAGNQNISAARMDADAAVTRTGHFPRSFYPSVEFRLERERNLGDAESDLSTGIDPRDVVSFGVDISVNIFSGGRDRFQEEARKATADRKDFELRRITSGEIEKGRISLLKILYLQEKIDLLNEAISINAENLAATRKRIRSGVATQSDRFDFEMKDVDLRRDLAAATLELAAERRLIVVLAGLDREIDSISFPEKLNHDHDDDSTITFTNREHEFLVKEHELRALELELAAKKGLRDGWPRLDLFASYNRYGEGYESTSAAEHPRGTSFGARISVDLLTGIGGRLEANSLMKESKAAKIRADSARRDVESHLKTELEALSFLHDQVHVAAENIVRAMKYHELTKDEYRRGVKNSPDMLGASEKLYEMRHKHLEIILEHQIAKAHILSKTGH